MCWFLEGLGFWVVKRVLLTLLIFFKNFSVTFSAWDSSIRVERYGVHAAIHEERERSLRWAARFDAI